MGQPVFFLLLLDVYKFWTLNNLSITGLGPISAARTLSDEQVRILPLPRSRGRIEFVADFRRNLHLTKGKRQLEEIQSAQNKRGIKVNAMRIRFD